MEELSNRIKATHYRKQLTNGYKTDSTFFKLVYRLTDEQILLNHAEHARESAEHNALLALYRSRASQDAPKECPIKKAMKACMDQV